MTEQEMIEWGRKEHQARLDDLAEFHAGRMELEEAQRRAKKRQRDSGLPPAIATRYQLAASRERRFAALT